MDRDEKGLGTNFGSETKWGGDEVDGIQKLLLLENISLSLFVCSLHILIEVVMRTLLFCRPLI